MKNYKNVALIALAMIAVAAGSFYVGSLRTQVKFYEKNMADINNPTMLGEEQFPTEAAEVPAPSEVDHIRGNRDAKIALIEYSDYDCSFCGMFHETAKQIVEDSNGEIMWIYRQFPLEGLHPEAYSKSIAAECVALQGGSEAFWNFSDALFAEEVTDIPALVGSLGLDVSSFNTCVENEETKAKVDADIESAIASGVNGTPGNFLMNLESGTTIEIFGALPYEELQNAIESIR